MLHLEYHHTSILTAEQHYQDLVNLFNHGIVKNEWTISMKNILTRGNLYIYHDIGLDPYVDDYIALKIIGETSKNL